MASKSKWHLDSGCFHDLTSCHLIIKREGKRFISHMGRFINILKKPIAYITPFIFSTPLKTLQVALKLACFKITEHASMFIPTHEPVATYLGNSVMAAHLHKAFCLSYPLHPKLSDFLPLYLHLCSLMTR